MANTSPVLIALTSTLFLCAGCLDNDAEQCWAPDSKKVAADLTGRTAIDYIVGIAKAAGDTGTPDEIKARVSSRCDIKLDRFYAVSKSSDGFKKTCGANAHFTYSKPDGNTVKNDAPIEFDIFKSESGPLYAVPKAPIQLMINTAAQ